MADTYSDKQLQRFEQTQREVTGSYSGGIRTGRVVGAGTKPSTDDATYWNIELTTHEFARSDVNFSDRFDTAKPVYVVLTNVAAPAGSSYAVDSVMSVQLQDVTATAGATVTDQGDFGYQYVPGNKSVVVSSGGGSSACYTSAIGWGPLWDTGA